MGRDCSLRFSGPLILHQINEEGFSFDDEFFRGEGRRPMRMQDEGID
jgi:hypothetical protein